MIFRIIRFLFCRPCHPPLLYVGSGRQGHTYHLYYCPICERYRSVWL